AVPARLPPGRASACPNRAAQGSAPPLSPAPARRTAARRTWPGLRSRSPARRDRAGVGARQRGGGQMLRSATTAMALAALSLAALPARADVLEIGEAGLARWVAGPAAQAESAPADMSADIAPGTEHL